MSQIRIGASGWNYQHWRDAIAGWAAQGRDVFAYFDNHAHGCAVHDARRLRDLVRQRCSA